MTRIYVAGPMTGLPDHNIPAFRAATKALRAEGLVVVDPSRRGSSIPGWGWIDYMRSALLDLVPCDEIALLPGWEKSSGARLEFHVATALGMKVRYLAGEAP